MNQVSRSPQFQHLTQSLFLIQIETLLMNKQIVKIPLGMIQWQTTMLKVEITNVAIRSELVMFTLKNLNQTDSALWMNWDTSM